MKHLAIDLDGTVLEDSWPALGDWMPGAVDALHELSKHAKILIHTCRIAEDGPDLRPRDDPAHVQMEINAIREKLDSVGLYTVEIWTKPYKPPAIAYVDNRGVRYNGRPKAWKALTPKLLNMLGEAVDYDDEEAVDQPTEVHG